MLHTHTHHTYKVPYECMCACIMRLRIKLLGICIANLTLIYVAKVGRYHIFPNKISNLPCGCTRSDNNIHYRHLWVQAHALADSAGRSCLFQLYQVPAACHNWISGAPSEEDLPSLLVGRKCCKTTSELSNNLYQMAPFISMVTFFSFWGEAWLHSCSPLMGYIHAHHTYIT